MARNKNQVSLIGQVGKDAEVRQTQQGVPYAHFTLATTSGGYKKKDGTEEPERTEWHSITCWRSLATVAGNFVKKGVKLDVEGSLHYGEYTDKQGVKHYTTEILANDIILMSKPQGTQNGASTGQSQLQPNNYPQEQGSVGYGQQSGQYGGAGSYGQQQSMYAPPPQGGGDLPF